MSAHDSLYKRSRYLLRSVLCRFIPERKFPQGYVPYLGSAWFSLTQAQCEYLISSLSTFSALYRFMHRVYCPEEMLVHTVLMNSKFKPDIINDDLHCITWRHHLNHPDVLRLEDFPMLQKARESQLFARKFDAAHDFEVLRAIDTQLLAEAPAFANE